MNKIITALDLGAALLGGTGALAQNDAPGMATTPLGDTDKQFLTQAAQGSIAD